VAGNLHDWLQRNSDRVLTQQRAQTDTAKLLVTFTLATTATVVATALQVGQSPSALDYIASGVLLVGFLLTICVILLDRIAEPNRNYAQDKATRRGWTDTQLLELLEGNHSGSGSMILRCVGA
jgi:hypothetical protein